MLIILLSIFIGIQPIGVAVGVVVSFLIVIVIIVIIINVVVVVLRKRRGVLVFQIITHIYMAARTCQLLSLY